MEQPVNLHFASGWKTRPGDEDGPDIYLAELVDKGSPIVSINPNSADFVVILAPGENCSLSNDKKEVIADCAGYPSTENRYKGNEITIEVNVAPLIRPSEDGLKATMYLNQVPEDGSPITMEALSRHMNEAGITSGIDKYTMERALEKLATAETLPVECICAKGNLPMNGQDAQLRFEIPVGPIPGKKRRDGSIDFRERRIFIGVDQDTHIATKIKATQGIPGVNIFGKTTQAKGGKDLKVSVAGNVVHDDITGWIFATDDGVLTVNNNEIRVFAKQTIDKDVSYDVGNIKSKDCVEVKGSIKPGFKVECKGDLLVNGKVESSQAICGGTGIFKGGVLGENTTVTTDGDADVSFIELSTLTAGGSVTIRKGAYYAHIFAMGKITGTPGSTILGGEVFSGDSIIANDIGAPEGGVALIAAGVDHKRYLDYLDLEQKIEETQSTINSLRANIGRSGNVDEDPRMVRLVTRLNRYKEQYETLNLIPDTPEYSRLEEPHTRTNFIIEVMGKIYQGTMLRIGNQTFTVPATTSNCVYRIPPGQDDIIGKPVLTTKKK